MKCCIDKQILRGLDCKKISSSDGSTSYQLVYKGEPLQGSISIPDASELNKILEQLGEITADEVKEMF